MLIVAIWSAGFAAVERLDNVLPVLIVAPGATLILCLAEKRDAMDIVWASAGTMGGALFGLNFLSQFFVLGSNHSLEAMIIPYIEGLLLGGVLGGLGVSLARHLSASADN